MWKGWAKLNQNNLILKKKKKKLLHSQKGVRKVCWSLEQWFSWRFHYRKLNPPKAQLFFHLIIFEIESTLFILSSLKTFPPISLSASDQHRVGNVFAFFHLFFFLFFIFFILFFFIEQRPKNLYAGKGVCVLQKSAS